MKKILVTNAGRSAGLNFCRSLRLAPEKYEIIGIEQNKYSLFNAECNKKYLCPNSDCPEYLDYIKDIVRKEKIDVIYHQRRMKNYGLFLNIETKFKLKHFCQMMI